MSGAFSGDQVPCGVTADAFYRKGLSSTRCGLLSLSSLSNRQHRETSEPIWIQRNGHDTTGAEFVTIACPDCFRTFPQVISGAASIIFETSCIFCQSSFHYGIVEPGPGISATLSTCSTVREPSNPDSSIWQLTDQQPAPNKSDSLLCSVTARRFGGFMIAVPRPTTTPEHLVENAHDQSESSLPRSP